MILSGVFLDRAWIEVCHRSQEVQRHSLLLLVQRMILASGIDRSRSTMAQGEQTNTSIYWYQYHHHRMVISHLADEANAEMGQGERRIKVSSEVAFNQAMETSCRAGLW